MHAIWPFRFRGVVASLEGLGSCVIATSGG